MGLVSGEIYEKTASDESKISCEIESLRTTKICPTESINKALESRGQPLINKPVSLLELLRRPRLSYYDIASLAGRELNLPDDLIRQIEVAVKYEGFIKRQRTDIERLSKIERIKLPAFIDYGTVHGLSSEIKEKLTRIKPLTLGQASRISGVTPAAVSILMIHLEKLRRMSRQPSADNRTP